jgi:hypothetical protein
MLYCTGGLLVVTLALAIYTGLLWKTTRKAVNDGEKAVRAAVDAASAANRSADVAVNVEMPMIFLERLDLETAAAPFGPSVRFPIQGAPPRMSGLTILFRNYGRTPAKVVHVVIQHMVGNALPVVPEYLHPSDIRGSHIIDSGGGGFRHDARTVIFILTDDEVDKIQRREAQLWIYGYIGFRDFLGTYHNVRFCGFWHWIEQGVGSDISPGFVESGAEIYHLRT